MSKTDKVKTHFKKNGKFYVGVIVGAATIGVVVLLTRKPSTLNNGISILGKEVTIKDSTLNNVSYFSVDRQGPPSWVIRCLENNHVETSQRKMAKAMGVPEGQLSQHLNGVRDHVNDLHFERICMAA